MLHRVTITVNGRPHELLVSPEETLVSVLRNRLELTGTKVGCELGACGACTVLVDGEAYLSCLTLALDAAGSEVTTIEGLSEGKGLYALQSSFIDHGAVQCGFCTPGMILTAKSVLDHDPNAGLLTIKRKMAGNLCRCTGYKKIADAILAVSGAAAGKSNE
jgi:carbon-monoxide dehydrogenase small subunit